MKAVAVVLLGGAVLASLACESPGDKKPVSAPLERSQIVEAKAGDPPPSEQEPVSDGICCSYEPPRWFATTGGCPGIIRTRDGGQMVGDGNITAPLLGLFVGWHGVRGLFRDPAALELDWSGSPPTPQPIDGTITDLCGATATIVTRPGAFDDFAICAAGFIFR